MPPPLNILCGKGGVGKTAVSLACGLRGAENGQRVLVVTSHPLEELALSISLQELKAFNPAADERLFIIHIDPRSVLARSVEEQFPSPFLVRKILNSRIYRSLVEIAPGIKELAFLQRLKELAEPEDDSAQRFDRIIWDAPATGHLLETLRVSRHFETYLTGPFASRGQDLSRFFREAAIHVMPVTTLEEMAVEESLEMMGRLKDELNFSPSLLICNQVSPLLQSADAGSFLAEELERRQALHPELAFVLERCRLEQQQFRHLKDGFTGPVELIRRVERPASDLHLLLEIGRQIEEWKWTG